MSRHTRLATANAPNPSPTISTLGASVNTVVLSITSNPLTNPSSLILADTNEELPLMYTVGGTVYCSPGLTNVSESNTQSRPCGLLVT